MRWRRGNFKILGFKLLLLFSNIIDENLHHQIVYILFLFLKKKKKKEKLSLFSICIKMTFFSRSMCYKVDQVWKNTFSNSCHFWLWSGFSNENITCDTREKYYCVFREKYFLVNCCLRRQEFFVTFSVTFLKTCVYLLLFHLSSIQYNYLVRPFFFSLSCMHMWPQ